jgi:hypothetical protein
MLPNNNTGFYIIHKGLNGRKRIANFYSTLEKLVTKNYNTSFSENLNEPIVHPDEYDIFDIDKDYSNFAFVVIDHNENIIPICELNRISNQIDDRRFNYRRHYGWNRSAYGNWRKPKTTQEKRAYFATKDEEETIKIRHRRGPKCLIDAYDDRYSHSDKNWKTQSKRSHQWKSTV